MRLSGSSCSGPSSPASAMSLAARLPTPVLIATIIISSSSISSTAPILGAILVIVPVLVPGQARFPIRIFSQRRTKRFTAGPHFFCRPGRLKPRRKETRHSHQKALKDKHPGAPQRAKASMPRIEPMLRCQRKVAGATNTDCLRRGSFKPKGLQISRVITSIMMLASAEHGNAACRS